MKTLNQVTVMALVMAASVSASGCKLAELKQAVVSSNDPVVAVPLIDFAPEDVSDEGTLRLVNNRFFLWPENVTPEVVTQASQLAREIDTLDDLAFPVNVRHNEVETQYEEQKSLRKTAMSQIKAIGTQTKTLSDQLAAEQAKPAESQDAALIASLEQQLSDLAGQKTARETEKAAAEDRMAEIEPELNELEGKQLDLGDRGQQAAAKIMALVDWPKTNPDSVSFSFATNEDGSVDSAGEMSGEIHGWEFSDDKGPRTFSTELGTLQDLKYQAKGGVFTFRLLQFENQDVQDVLQYTYCFKLARSKYDRMKTDVRKFFAGDILRVNGATETCDFDTLKKLSKKDASLGLRLGVAKLVDRNN